jgi:hypothetical protein
MVKMSGLLVLDMLVARWRFCRYVGCSTVEMVCQESGRGRGSHGIQLSSRTVVGSNH